MTTYLHRFGQVFSLPTQHSGSKAQSTTAVIALAGMAGFSALVYLLAITQPYSLFDRYQYPRLTLYDFNQENPLAQGSLICAFLGLGLFYWLSWRAALHARGRAAWLIVLGGTLIFSLILLFLYPFDAADIFDNIMHGRISGVYGANSFRDVAQQFSADPFLPYMAWRRSPSAYGPIWEAWAGGVARLVGDGVIANVLAFKLLGGGFLGLAIALVALILRRQAPDRALAGVVLLAWNPAVLYETMGKGHNDIAMTVWLLVAVWALLSRRYTLAVLALNVGMLVKFIPILLLPLVCAIAWRNLPTLRARLRFLVTTGLASLVLVVMVYGPVWYGLETLTLERRTRLFTASLPATIHAWLQLTLGQENPGLMLSIVAAALTLLFVLWQSWRSQREDSWLNFTQAAFTIVMFYLLVTCLWFQQWYVIWPLTLAALLPPGHAPRLAVLFSFAAMSKDLLFGPWLFWPMPRPPRAWLELRFGPAVMLIPWLYVGLTLWLRRQTKAQKDDLIQEA